jgi:hypothetical protein
MASSSRLTIFIAVIAIVLTFVFFPPHLWLLASEIDGGRAFYFLQQSELPFRHDIDPVLRWRLLPALIAYVLRLPGHIPLIIPWLGVLAATAYVGLLLQQRSSDWRFILGGTLVFTTTSAVLVPMHWPGYNDSWVWLGLLVIAFGNSQFAIIAAMLLCPWIDERFIIGWPLAWGVRCIDKEQSLISLQLASALWFLPYVAVRIGLGGIIGAANDVAFIKERLQELHAMGRFIPLGWWMGLRAAWLPIGYALWQINKRTNRAQYFFIFAATLVVPVLVSADTSRSIADLVPLALLGIFMFLHNHSALSPKAVLITGICGLLLPAMHVFSFKTDLIDNLAIETFRLIRGD